MIALSLVLTLAALCQSGPPMTFQEAVDAAPDGAVIYADEYRPEVKVYAHIWSKSLSIVGGTFEPTATEPALYLGGSGVESIDLIGCTVRPRNGRANWCVVANGPRKVTLDGCTITADARSAGAFFSWYPLDLQASASTIGFAARAAQDCEFDFECGPGIYNPGVLVAHDLVVRGADAPLVKGDCIGPFPYCASPGGPAVVVRRVRDLGGVDALGGLGVRWASLGCQGPAGPSVVLTGGMVR